MNSRVSIPGCYHRRDRLQGLRSALMGVWTANGGNSVWHHRNEMEANRLYLTACGVPHKECHLHVLSTRKPHIRSRFCHDQLEVLKGDCVNHQKLSNSSNQIPRCQSAWRSKVYSLYALSSCGIIAGTNRFRQHHTSMRSGQAVAHQNSNCSTLEEQGPSKHTKHSLGKSHWPW